MLYFLLITVMIT